MMLTKKFRKLHSSQSSLPNRLHTTLPGLQLRRLFTTGLLLVGVVLVTSMGFLLEANSSAETPNCPCSALNNRLTHEGTTVTKTELTQSITSPLAESNLAVIGLTIKNTTPIADKFKPGWWQNHTRTVCKSLGLSTNQRDLQPDMLGKVLVDDTHKILYCQIAKAESTNLDNIFAMITGTFHGINPDAIHSDDVIWKYSQLHVHLDSFPVHAVHSRLKHYFKFVFVREPFERLLSGYREKFLKQPGGYFAYLNNKLVRMYRTNTTDAGVVTFTEFVTYLIDKKRQVPMNGHWQPMYELCRPCETNYDFVGKISSFNEDVHHILKTNNLTGITALPKHFTSHISNKTGVYMEDYYSQVPKTLLLDLYKMYYPDYAIFDFQLPEIIKKLIQ